MAGRVKIRSKVVNATIQNRDVLDMFQGVMGGAPGGAALSITYPKYKQIKNHVYRFIALLKVLNESAILALFPGPSEHLGNYRKAFEAQAANSFSAPDLESFMSVSVDGMKLPLPDGADAYRRIPPEVIEKFNEVFTAVKACNAVNVILVTCKNLVSHKKSLQNMDALSDRFLTKDAGTILCPIHDLSQLNFKQMYIDDRLTEDNKKFLLVILHKLYQIGHDLYEVISSPDVDTSEFVEVIMSSIMEVKKHIPRCDQAFAKIVDSVGLLKNNFGGYYKDYVASSNPTIIMENFVLDVSKSTDSSPQVTAQFRKIITHYRKLASQQATNPKLQSLFQQVDKNFQEIGASGKNDDDDEGEGDPSPEPTSNSSPATQPNPGSAKPSSNSGQKSGQKSKPASNSSQKSKPTGSDQATPPKANMKKKARGAPPAAAAKPREEGLVDELNRAPQSQSVPAPGPEPTQPVSEPSRPEPSDE